MNRWRQRLDELQGEGLARPLAPSCTVQNVQNVQKPPPDLGFERCEQIEQRTESASTSVASTTWAEVEEERAAIVGYDGGIPRAWAEGFARLDPGRPPGDLPAKRWLRFIDDTGRFLDGPFRAVAAALGWGPYDLFGCDRDRPFARIDRAGLLWLLNGDTLVELTESTATIETPTGARQSWRRKPSLPGRVIPWEVFL